MESPNFNNNMSFGNSQNKSNKRKSDGTICSEQCTKRQLVDGNDRKGSIGEFRFTSSKECRPSLENQHQERLNKQLIECLSDKQPTRLDKPKHSLLDVDRPFSNKYSRKERPCDQLTSIRRGTHGDIHKNKTKPIAKNIANNRLSSLREKLAAEREAKKECEAYRPNVIKNVFRENKIGRKINAATSTITSHKDSASDISGILGKIVATYSKESPTKNRKRSNLSDGNKGDSYRPPKEELNLSQNRLNELQILNTPTDNKKSVIHTSSPINYNISSSPKQSFSFMRALENTINSSFGSQNETSVFSVESMECDDILENISKNDDQIPKDTHKLSSVYHNNNTSKDDQIPKDTSGFSSVYLNNNFSKDSISCSQCKKVYVVIDTNVFVNNLSVIVDIMKLRRNGLIVYVPYQTLRELDYLKEKGQMSAKRNAVIAINYISDKLNSNNSRLQGQSIVQALHRDIKASGADESILACCVQLQTQGYVILLTGDKNLQNMALISNLKAYSPESIIKQLHALPEEDIEENPVVEEISDELSKLWSFILVKRLKETCGSNWQKKVTLPPPWTTKQCLRIFHKFWSVISCTKESVDFSEFGLSKQCRKAMEDFLEFLESRKKIGPEDVLPFIEFGNNVCLFLMEGFPVFENNIKQCVDLIEAKTSII